MEKKPFQIRIPQEEKKIFQDKAKSEGTSVAKMMRRASLFYSAFPTDFFKQIESISEQMGITATDIIVNICLNQVAADKAFLDVFGESRKSLMRAFQWKDGKMIRGDELLKNLHDEYKSIFEGVKSNLQDVASGRKPIVSRQEFQEIAQLF
jgi:antitoxin component of RelBE/YafQ-DinJ toxin-antitoxin module